MVPVVEHLFTKLSRRDLIGEVEREALFRVIRPDRRHAAGGEIVAPFEELHSTRLLVDGVAARVSMLRNGARQFTQVLLPGDFLDLHGLLMGRMEHAVVALSGCVTASITHEALRDITARHPHFARLLWLETIIDAAGHREWIVGWAGRTRWAARPT